MLNDLESKAGTSPLKFIGKFVVLPISVFVAGVWAYHHILYLTCQGDRQESPAKELPVATRPAEPTTTYSKTLGMYHLR